MAFAIVSIPSNIYISSMPYDFQFGKGETLNIMLMNRPCAIMVALDKRHKAL